MALTNYTIYRWLINLLEKEADEQRGMTLKDISQQYLWDRDKIFGYNLRTGRTRTGLPEHKVELVDAEGKKHIEYQGPKITSKTFLNWRNAIYQQFGLIIQQTIFKNVVQNRYYLANPELLDENKTLRATIDYLVDEETRGYEAKTLLTVSPRGRKAKAKGVDGTMGFVSVGDNNVDYSEPQFGYQNEPEMVDTIRFLMTIGEALVIRKNSKNMVLEAQALKCINDRWYVLGNVYEYGDKETLKPVIYDVLDLHISDDEDVVGPLYKVMDDYDIYKLIPDDWSEHFDPDKVVSIYFKVAGRLFEDTPFCQAQEKVNINVGLLHNVYRVFVKADKDFYLQYMAYGDNVRVYNHFDKIKRTTIDITDDQIVYLKSLRQRYL